MGKYFVEAQIILKKETVKHQNTDEGSSLGCLTSATLEVPGLTWCACLWDAFTLAAVGVPETNLAVKRRASLDLADLALATVSVELLIGSSAEIGGKRALALASNTVEGVARWVWASLLGVFAVSGDGVEELTWWAVLGSDDLRASLSVEDVSFLNGFLVSALAGARVVVEEGWVSVNVLTFFWSALARARLNVEVLRAVLEAASEVVHASAAAGRWVPVVAFSAALWLAVAAA